MPQGTEEITEPVIEETTDADFESGFSGEPTETPVATEESTEPAEVVPEEPEAETPPVPETFTMTKSDYEALMSKAAEIDQIKPSLDKAFGKIGGVERILSQVQQGRVNGNVQVTAEDFAEMAAEFPELAQQQAAGLNRVLSKLNSGAAPDVEKLFAERMAPMEMRLGKAELTVSHPDWLSQVNSDVFHGWLKSLPADEAQNTMQSMDANFVSSQLTRFKEATKAQAQQAQAAAKTDRAKAVRQKQIQAAVTPKSAGGYSPGTSGDDEFMAGFNGR